MSDWELPVKAGDVIEVGPAAWRYGDGLLRIRVTSITGDSYSEGGEPWLEVRGVAVGLDGLPGEERIASVRVSALPEAKLAGLRRLAEIGSASG